MRLIRRIPFVALAAVVTLGAGGAIAVNANEPPSPPEYGLVPEDQQAMSPRFVAVSNGRGGIAGYAEASLLDGTGDLPANPAEAVARSREGGTVIRVFSQTGEVVGYWGSGGAGFIDESAKANLVAEGWRYIAGNALGQQDSVQPSSSDMTSPPSTGG